MSLPAVGSQEGSLREEGPAADQEVDDTHEEGSLREEGPAGDQEVDDTHEDNDGPPPAKKGRGRPKKALSEKEDDTPVVSEDGKDNDGPPPARRGRGRPKKALSEKEDDTQDVAEDGKDNDGPPPAKRGRGRPKKALSEKEDETADVSEDGKDNDGPPPANRGRGRPKKALSEKAHRQESAAKKGRGRPKKSEKELDDPSGDSKKPKYKKRAKVTRERSIESGKLREGRKISYIDESSDDERQYYYSSKHSKDSKGYKGHVSSDNEDFRPETYYERKLARNWTDETKEARSLREQTSRQSYKDDSDSDLESGFESDIIVPQRGPHKGRGRPKKTTTKAAAPVKKKGVRKLGRPKGSFKQMKVEATESSEEDNQS